MPRKLKIYQTSLGFYELAIAAPSMKAALEAWGAGSNLFHQGAASETDDPEVVAATTSKPGVVLKRPAGSSGRFAEDAELPDLPDEDAGTQKGRRPSARKQPAVKISEKSARKAAAGFGREQKRRETARRREQAAQRSERAKREKMVAKAQASLETAQLEHDERTQALRAERDAIDNRMETENARWERRKGRLTKALHRARE